MKRLSISQRLKKAKSPAVKLEVLQDWTENWQQEQERLCLELGQAIDADDYDQLCQVSGQLKAVTEKRFTALPKLFESLLNADSSASS